MRLLIISILFTFSFNFSISQEDNYKGLLTDFIKAQGQFETFNATIDQMTSMMGVTLNEDKKVEFTNDVMSSLIEMLVPVYQKHFTEQDLKDAIELFNSANLFTILSTDDCNPSTAFLGGLSGNDAPPFIFLFLLFFLPPTCS